MIHHVVIIESFANAADSNVKSESSNGTIWLQHSGGVDTSCQGLQINFHFVPQEVSLAPCANSGRAVQLESDTEA